MSRVLIHDPTVRQVIINAAHHPTIKKTMSERATILQGDALAMLRTMEAESVHCVVTSPPYWGLRDYGTPGQLGLEATPEAHVAAMVEVFREVRRVLRSDGTLWLNEGDSYASASACDRRSVIGNGSPDDNCKRPNRLVNGLKEKDLVGIPWMLAFALRADGWWLRSDIIWSKPNPMPESVTDRPTKAHEYLFLLSKAASYYYDAEAIRESHLTPPYLQTERPETSRYKVGMNGDEPVTVGGSGFTRNRHHEGGRNRRTVWTIPTAPYPEAHFATFPPDLVRPCILAGTSERGVCAACGAPWVRVTESVNRRRTHGTNGVIDGAQGGNRRGGTSVFVTAEIPVRATTGWNQSCKCDSGEPIPATVLDPFAGSCTTGQVALEYGRRFIGIELNADYVKLAEKRMASALAQELLAL